MTTSDSDAPGAATPVPRSAYVTGGSGFIGGVLVRRLVAGGCTVRALARSSASAATVAELGAVATPGDLADVESMARGMAGSDVVFHLAAHLGQSGPLEDFVRGNVDGTRNALEAARRAGVRRFVHCGTEAALMAGEPLVQVDETAPLRPDSPGAYSATKARAEELVRRAADAELETVVVHPRFVWGPGDTTLVPEILAMVEAGKFRWIGGGRQLTSVTHVDNVVEGLLLGAARGRSGEAYFVTDGEDAVFREFLSELIEANGGTAPSRSVPRPVAWAVASAGDLAWRILPLGGEPPLPKFTYWLSSQECTIRIDKARTELGYAPVTDREHGMAGIRSLHPD